MMICVEVGILQQLETHVVEALEGAHAGGSDGNGLGLVSDEFLQGAPMHTNVFRMHLVALDFLALDGLERACSHVEGHFLAVDATHVESGEHAVGEMESGRRCGHTTLDFRIDRLVGGLVALLRVPIQIGRNG